MNMKLSVVILSALFTAKFVANGYVLLTAIPSLIETVYDLYGKFSDARDFFGEFGDSESSIDDVLAVISALDKKLDQLETKLARKMDMVLDTMLDRLPEIIDIKSDMRLLRDQTMRIDFLYDSFKIYSANLSQWNSVTLRNFAETVIGHSLGGVPYILESAFNVIIPRRSVVFQTSLLVRLKKEIQKQQRNACDESKTVQLQLFEMYTAILVTEMRGLLMTIFSYKLQSSFIDNNSSIMLLSSKAYFIFEVNLVKRNFRKRVTAYTDTIQQVMHSAPRILRRCDPSKEHVRGKTFHEFERFMYAFVIKETTLYPDPLCYKTCDSVDNVKLTHTDFIYENTDVKRTLSACSGTVTSCTNTLRRGVRVCVSWWFDKKRYAWFIDDQVTYGNAEDQCSEGVFVYYSWGMRGFNYCDICLCTCVEDSYLEPVTRFISLLSVVSDIRRNKVVTGLKFISSENVIQIQIQEGKLEKYGTIDEATVSWQVPNRIEFMIVSSMQEKKHVFQMRWAEGSGVSPLKFNKHITSFNHQNRTINLDALHVPKDHVVTGIKFDQVTGNGKNSCPIQLSIRATPFDYDTGELKNIRASVWITPENMTDSLTAYGSERAEITNPEEAMDPTQKVMPTTPHNEPNKWINIRNTGLKGDAGQTVIPLLDALEVTPNPRLPLSGVNLFHKATEGYGGFLSFQITTIDMANYTNHLRDNILKRLDHV